MCVWARLCVRVRFCVQAHTQMALLLSKYDCNVSLATGNVKDQLDHVVDELFERVTVCALLDPPARYMQCFMFNVETQEFEQYPQGWWTQVVKVKRQWGGARGRGGTCYGCCCSVQCAACQLAHACRLWLLPPSRLLLLG